MDVEDDYSYTNAEKVKILRKDPTVKSDGNGGSPEGIEDHGEEDKQSVRTCLKLQHPYPSPPHHHHYCNRLQELGMMGIIAIST